MLPLYALVLAADPAPPPIRLPAEVSARPGRLVRLEADTPAPIVRWLVVGDADLVPLPGSKAAVLASPTAGRLLVIAWTASGDVPSEAARCVVVVGDPAPPAPPPAPPPADPLAADLRAAFAADPSPQRAGHARQLAAAYRQAGTASGSARTAAELYEVLKQHVTAGLPADALTGVRKRVAAEIGKTVPADADAPLDAATRAAVGKLFARLATLLEELK